MIEVSNTVYSYQNCYQYIKGNTFIENETKIAFE